MTGPPLDFALARGRAMGQIQTCDRCSYFSSASAPVVFRGPSPSRLMIVADSPGPTDDRVGKPLVGAAGRWLREQFSDHRLPDLSKWFITYAVKCRPPEDESPDKPHMAACSPHLRAEVVLCDPSWVLTLGKASLWATGVNAEISKVHGRPFVMPAGPFVGRWIFPTLHPMQVFRDQGKQAVIAADLSTFARILSGRMEADSIQLVVGRNGRLVPPS